MTGDQQKDSQLIGQFGVGFYSAFIVADKVTVDTRKADAAEGVRWVSDGSGEFTVEAIDKEKRGTAITLHLKDRSAGEFADGYRLRSIIRKYSDHISLPILMLQGRSKLPQKVKKKSRKTRRRNGKPFNTAKALWTRSRSDSD